MEKDSYIEKDGRRASKGLGAALESLSRLLEGSGVSVRRVERAKARGRRFPARSWDATFQAGAQDRTFWVGLLASPSGEPARLLSKLAWLPFLRSTLDMKRDVEIVYAPYLSPYARKLCRETKVCFLDGVGNCDLRFGSVVISRESSGRGSESRRSARSLFAPKSTRVIRTLLADPWKRWTQAGLSRETGLSLGHLNRLVRRLEEERYVRRIGGRLAPSNASGLLSRWMEQYSFQSLPRLSCYSAGTPEELELAMESLAAQGSFRYALTSFSGAKYRAPFTTVAETYAYYGPSDEEDLRDALGLSPGERGANVFLITPADQDVFRTVQLVQGRRVVCDVQLYVDLMTAGGRGKEQADFLVERGLVPAAVAPKGAPARAYLNDILTGGKEREALVDARPTTRAILKDREEEFERRRHLASGVRRKEYLQIAMTLWLARLQVSFDEGDRALFEASRKVFSSDFHIGEAETVTGLSRGLGLYGLLLRAALELRFFTEDGHAVRHARRDFAQCLRLIRDPAVNPDGWIGPLVDEVEAKTLPLLKPR